MDKIDLILQKLETLDSRMSSIESRLATVETDIAAIKPHIAEIPAIGAGVLDIGQRTKRLESGIARQERVLATLSIRSQETILQCLFT